MQVSHSRYWALKEQILGVSAPMARSQEDLDPPTIFHINQVLILKFCKISKRESLIHKYHTPFETFFCRTLTWSVTSPEPSYSSSLLQNFVTFQATLDRCTGKVLPRSILERFLTKYQQKKSARCDFSGSKEAGSALAKMLSLGSSRPWQVIMKLFWFSSHFIINFVTY